jgi:hypothetical protein
MTAAWPWVALEALRFWRHTTQFFDAQTAKPYWQSRMRSPPILHLEGYPLIVAGWIFVFDRPRHGVAPDAWQLVGLAAFGLMFVLFVIGLAVFFINRPRWAVPPHLRAEHGYLAARRSRTERSTS